MGLLVEPPHEQLMKSKREVDQGELLLVGPVPWLHVVLDLFVKATLELLAGQLLGLLAQLLHLYLEPIFQLALGLIV